MKTATLITQGRSQTVELPEGIHIDATEVYVKRVGRSIVLTPKDAKPWETLLASLDQFPDDFMAERAQPTQQQQREDPFN
jgi:antitoxin VapB